MAQNTSFFVPLMALAVVAFILPLVVCFPVGNTYGSAPFQQSSDVWAQVVTNVAPLMALVGERNAKEHMRTASSWPQFLALSTAPLGILSILVSAIRLTGPGFLRRLVGRDSERRSEALVELTPLSVYPATSVYTPRAVEIEPFHSKDKVAFVCAHARDVHRPQEAIETFRALLEHKKTSTQLDCDTEISLALFSTHCTLQQLDTIAAYLNGDPEGLDPAIFAVGTAAISYRTTGVCPTETGQSFGVLPKTLTQWQDVGASVFFALSCIGLQIPGAIIGSTSITTFWMGIVGYVAVALSTFSLLALVKSETNAEAHHLPDIFKDAYWTFSDSRHAEHKPMQGPISNTLVVARPRKTEPNDVLRRQIMTSVLTFFLCASYVFFYLSIRVAPFWVALGILGIIWLGAFYRAIVPRNFLLATAQDTGNNEHWIGMFRNTVSESLIATLECADVRKSEIDMPEKTEKPLPEKKREDSDSTVAEPGYVIIDKKQPEWVTDAQAGTVLFVLPPFRLAMRTWSGAEDVMKVGLEVTKQICKTRTVTFNVKHLNKGPWSRIASICMMVYVPGFIWTSEQPVSIALERDFSLELILRLLLKVMHVCLDHPGTITPHDYDQETSTKLSHVLCGPIADLKQTSEFTTSTRTTLRDVLTALKDLPSCAETLKFSLEQAVLLPTILLCSIFESTVLEVNPSCTIQALQNSHVDGLALSGAAYLSTLQSELDKHKILDKFMAVKRQTEQTAPQAPPEARDSTSGNYVQHNLRDRLSDRMRNAIPRGEDGGLADAS